MVRTMEELISNIKEEFNNCSDLIIHKIKNRNKYVYLVYLETLCSSTQINDFILKKLTENSKAKNILDFIPTPHTIKLENSNLIEFYLNHGFSIVISDECIYACETKAELTRSISSPSTEPSLYGPKDAFVENIQQNMGLIKRRISDSHLKNKNYNIGRLTKTTCSVIYVDNVVKKSLVNKICKSLNGIDIDGILDAGNLKKLIENENKNVFPSTQITERPDVVCKNLLLGKVVILVDNSPFAIIVPAFFADFINPIVDNYSKSINTNFLKFLRLLCFILGIVTPGIYVALTNFNQEAIPLELLISFSTQREGVPFPAIVECLIMLITCEILRESDIRFPSSYGSAISILGALVLGEAAVSAGIVSPIMIIVIAITFIASLMFSDLETIASIRTWRFIFLLFAAFWGLYGISLSIVFLLISLCSNNSFGYPYFFPIQPFDLSYIKSTLFEAKSENDNKRSKMLSNNIIKKRDS